MQKRDLRVNNQKISAVLENPGSEKIFVLVHGFTGDMHGPNHIFEKLSKEIQKRDIAVIRFNFRGTPPSEGEFQDMTIDSESTDLREIYRYIRAKGYKKIGVLGESMGGTVALNSLEKDISTVVFWYPAFDLNDTSLIRFLSPGLQNELTKKGYVNSGGFKVGKRFVDQIREINLFDKIINIDVPVLFLHGDKDSDVPCGQSERAFDLVKSNKELHIIKGAGHCFPNEQEIVIDLTVRFIEKYF